MLFTYSLLILLMKKGDRKLLDSLGAGDMRVQNAIIVLARNSKHSCFWSKRSHQSALVPEYTYNFCWMFYWRVWYRFQSRHWFLLMNNFWKQISKLSYRKWIISMWEFQSISPTFTNLIEEIFQWRFLSHRLSPSSFLIVVPSCQKKKKWGKMEREREREKWREREPHTLQTSVHSYYRQLTFYCLDAYQKCTNISTILSWWAV